MLCWQLESLHDNALVVVGDKTDFDVKRVLVDKCSVTNVLTYEAFLGLKISPELLKTMTIPLQHFGGHLRYQNKLKSFRLC